VNPIITGITPNKGRTMGGYFIKILGENFSLYGCIVEFGNDTIGWMKAKNVMVTETGEIVVAPPKFSKFPISRTDGIKSIFPIVVSIRISNLDPSKSIVINPETLEKEASVKEECFTYSYVSFVKEKGNITWVKENFKLRHLQEFSDKCVFYAHRDYTDDGISIKPTGTFGLVVSDPVVEKDHLRTYAHKDTTINPNSGLEYNSYLNDAIGVQRHTEIVNIIFTLIFYAKSNMILENMLAVYENFMVSNVKFGIPSVISDYESSQIEYEYRIKKQAQHHSKDGYHYAVIETILCSIPKHSLQNGFIDKVDYIYEEQFLKEEKSK